MKRPHGVPLSISAVVNAPVELAWSALGAIVDDLEVNPGREALALELAELEIPLEAKLAVPIAVRFGTEPSLHERAISIEPATRRDIFPRFSGVLALQPTLAGTCRLHLDGAYTLPLGSLGKAIDITLMRGAAKSSLQDFLDRLSQQLVEHVERSERKYAHAVFHV